MMTTGLIWYSMAHKRAAKDSLHTLEDRRNFFWEYPSSGDKTILQGVELVVLLQLLRQRLSSTSDLLMNSNHWFVIFLGESKSIIEGVEAN